MNSNQSSSEQFMLYLKSLGGSEADVTGPGCMVCVEDTVESVVSRMRRERHGRGNDLVEPVILQASAQVLISRRDQTAPAASPESRKGDCQADAHHRDAGTNQGNHSVREEPERH